MPPCLLVVVLLLGPPTRGDAAAFAPTSDYEVRDVRGFSVRVLKAFLRADPDLSRRTLDELQFQLYQIERLAPPSAVARLRSVVIWIEEDEPHHPCMAYHPDAGWLRGAGMNPDKARCVEIANARNFLDWSRKAQPFMMLHELAHALHHQILPDGFENPAVKAAFQDAAKAHRYAAVLRSDGHTEPAYAAKNPQEYFAEASEAFFGVNDFYPFLRAELRQHDPRMADLIRSAWNLESLTGPPAHEKEATSTRR